MKKTKTDNSDIIDYLNTTQELKKYPDIKSFWQEYRRLREDAPIGKTNQFYSAHKELRRLDKK
ncbi:DUF4756 family protein [Cedecea neteri]|uniref:DUF4756 family protein n=2 Tax=Enterobacteriaceae TaxID=543 RepID=UPI000AAE290A